MKQHQVGISLLKAASAERVGRGIASALRAGGKAVKTVARVSGDVGEGVAKGLGGDPAVGRALGITAAAGGTIAAGREAKQRYDERRMARLYGGGF